MVKKMSFKGLLKVDSESFCHRLIGRSFHVAGHVAGLVLDSLFMGSQWKEQRRGEVCSTLVFWTFWNSRMRCSGKPASRELQVKFQKHYGTHEGLCENDGWSWFCPSSMYAALQYPLLSLCLNTHATIPRLVPMCNTHTTVSPFVPMCRHPC